MQSILTSKNVATLLVCSATGLTVALTATPDARLQTRQLLGDAQHIVADVAVDADAQLQLWYLGWCGCGPAHNANLASSDIDLDVDVNADVTTEVSTQSNNGGHNGGTHSGVRPSILGLNVAVDLGNILNTQHGNGSAIDVDATIGPLFNNGSDPAVDIKANADLGGILSNNNGTEVEASVVVNDLLSDNNSAAPTVDIQANVATDVLGIAGCGCNGGDNWANDLNISAAVSVDTGEILDIDSHDDGSHNNHGGLVGNLLNLDNSCGCND